MNNIELEVEIQERLGYRIQEEMTRRIIDYYIQNRDNKIRQSKFNPVYMEIIPMGREGQNI